MKKIISVIAVFVCSIMIINTAAWAHPAYAPGAIAEAVLPAELLLDDASKNPSAADKSASDKAPVQTVNDLTSGRVDPDVYDAVHEILDDPWNQLTSIQRLLLEACARTPAARAGYCATWVSNVFSCIGISVSGNANDMWAKYCTEEDIFSLAPGMLIAVQHTGTDHSSAGYIYGHVGIYIGGNKVIDSHSVILSSSNSLVEVRGETAVIPLDEWLQKFDTYGTVRWGFPEELDSIVRFELESPDPVMLSASLPEVWFMEKESVTEENSGAEESPTEETTAAGADDKSDETSDTEGTDVAPTEGPDLPASPEAMCFTWSPTMNTDGYYVFRDGIIYTRIDDARQTYFIDTDAESGSLHTYRLYSFQKDLRGKITGIFRIPDPVGYDGFF